MTLSFLAVRDGVKLHTVILVPNGAKSAPILMTRTPYNATALTTHSQSIHLGPTLHYNNDLFGVYDNAADVIVDGGYIRVVQDIRGKYGSEGDFVMNRPLHGPQNPTPVDEATDTYDTIDWLIKNIPESNKKVGILGISYDGFLPLMAVVNPHPALKVSVPMNPMVDGWMGDDWFHYGAFRQQNLPYIYEQEATRKNDAKWWSDHFDDYDLYMDSGSVGELGHRARIHIQVVIVEMVGPPLGVVLARGLLLIDVWQVLLAECAVVEPVIAHPAVDHGIHGNGNFKCRVRVDQGHQRQKTVVGDAEDSNLAVGFGNVLD